MQYTVINSQDKKSKISLLQAVSGYLNPGEMSALVCIRPGSVSRQRAGFCTVTAAVYSTAALQSMASSFSLAATVKRPCHVGVRPNL